MNLPPFAPYPQAGFRKQLVPQEWEACLDAWLSLSELYLRLPQQDFDSLVRKNDSLSPFLQSYYYETSKDQHNANYSKLKETTLRKSCFILTHRVLLNGGETPAKLLQWDFLSDFSHAYMKTQSLELLLQKVWQKKSIAVEGSLHSLASALIKQLESSTPDAAEDSLERVAPFLYASPDTGKCLMTGSDFMDALSSSYYTGSFPLQQSLVTVAYLGFASLLKGVKPNYSILFDHLYSLKSQAEVSQKAQGSLLADLVTNTPLLTKLRTEVSGKDVDRAQKLAITLDPFRFPSLNRPRKNNQRKPSKGKGKGKAAQGDEYGHGAFSGEQHIHRMSLITQIQDLFPDLGPGFISRLLDEYNENPEEVTAHLLDESLPPHLSGLDRSAPLAGPPPSRKDQEQAKIEHLAPRSTPPPQRRNVFDDDEFDRLEVDASRMHVGRKNAKLTADAILTDRSTAPAKSAILSALAAFDSDDDERDDTYDEADVGGTVDATGPDGEESRETDLGNLGEHDETLFRAWQLDRHVFERSSEVRRSPARAALKSETGMQDEAIEGWGVMLARDPRRIRRFEARFSAFHGGQRELESTKYRESGDTTEDSDVGGSGGRGGGRGRGRGRGRGGGGRGGNVAGAPGDKSTQIARQRKDQRGGNRRDQRARKMARGGFPG